MHHNILPILHKFWHINQSLRNTAHPKGRSIDAQILHRIEREITDHLLRYKMTGSSTHYIWHSQDDEEVCSSHAANNGKIFA